MPEFPDLEVYAESLTKRLQGATLKGIRFRSVFLLRSVEPPASALTGCLVERVERFGKRLLFRLEQNYFILLHLMIAGRLAFRDLGAPIPAKVGLAALDFSTGTVMLTEASTQKRAALYLLQGDTMLQALARGGLEVLACSYEQFAAAMRQENHTLKRSLTDQRIISGIGNAYSDEILHRARLSPLKLTSRVNDDEMAALFAACRHVLQEWVVRLRNEAGDDFPTKVTAFRPDMAVHGRYKEPCPICGNKVMRIVYAANECNYCATCQNAGRLLADRALSRLLKDDWPKTAEELEVLPAALGRGEKATSH